MAHHKMRFKTLVACLEEKCFPVSWAGLKERYPHAYTILEEEFNSNEVYEGSIILTDSGKTLDSQYAFYVVSQKQFVVVERMDFYEQDLYEAILLQVGFDINKCAEMIEATK